MVVLTLRNVTGTPAWAVARVNVRVIVEATPVALPADTDCTAVQLGIAPVQTSDVLGAVVSIAEVESVWLLPVAVKDAAL